ncbi:MAG: pyruvate ferredoxin oxidoreductase [Prevotella sp.]|nr:pyruvate ferredoxin oxidoreductase [Prevotella sp.]
MDYKFIEQLVERYFEGQTTLQEEEILRIFFSQEELPAGMESVAALFAMEQTDRQMEMLSEDFDVRMLEMIGKETQEPKTLTVKAKTISFTQRLIPLFKAAAIVAIILTLGNAAQAPWDRGYDDPKAEYARYHQQQMDSTDDLQPMQAENLTDSLKQEPATLAPTY